MDPLIEGVDPSWNSILEYVPEDKRPELVSPIQEFESKYKDLEPWKEFTDSNVSPDVVKQALDVFRTLNEQPHQVYEVLGNYLGVTTQEAKEIVEENKEIEGEESSSQKVQDDPRISKMEQQLNTLAQIALAQKKEEEQRREDQALDKELKALREKYNYPEEDEEQIVMRMAQKGLDAEAAYKEYASYTDKIRQRRPAPFVMGSGSGQVPTNNIDVSKLDRKGTKDLVSQMLRHANSERV